MRAIVNGKLYDTETANLVASHEHVEVGFLFFMTYGEGGAETQYAEHLPDGATRWGCAIRPITKEEAKEWVLAHSRDVEYRLFFGEEPKENK